MMAMLDRRADREILFDGGFQDLLENPSVWKSDFCPMHTLVKSVNAEI